MHYHTWIPAIPLLFATNDNSLAALTTAFIRYTHRGGISGLICEHEGAHLRARLYIVSPPMQLAVWRLTHDHYCDCDYMFQEQSLPTFSLSCYMFIIKIIQPKLLLWLPD
jgi:hypothetical protein